MSSIQFGASLAKTLFPYLGATGTTVARTSIAACLLLAIWRPWRVRFTRSALLRISFYGLALGCMNLLFYLSLLYIPLGIAVALEFTGPLALALFSARRRLDFFWAGLAIIGIVLILPVNTSDSALSLTGILYALGAGCCWALYILFGKRAGSTANSGQVTALGMLVAAIVVLPSGVSRLVEAWSQTELFLLALAVAIFSSALPYSLEMMALKRLPMRTFGILMSLEPALAAIMGYVFLGEHLSWLQCLAILSIMAASAGSTATAPNLS